MLGIICKDLYETFCLKKNMISMIFIIIFFLFVFFTFKSFYMLLLIVCVSIPWLGVTALQCSMEQDEICKFDQILLTYPVTRKEIIKSKLISNFILIGFSNVLISLPCVLIYIFLYNVCDFKAGMLVWLFGIIISFMITAINSIGFMLLGNKKGSIMFIVFILIYCFVYMSLNWKFDLISWFSSSNVVLLICTLIAVVMTVLSYYICLKIYNFKHS